MSLPAYAITMILPTHSVQVTSVGTDTSPHHHRCWLLHLLLMTAWIKFFVFDAEDSAAILDENKLTRPCLTTELPSDLSSGPESSVAFLHRNDARLCLCVTEFQVAFLDAALDCFK